MRRTTGLLTGTGVLAASLGAIAWNPLPVESDPLVRMPGTQHGDGVMLAATGDCVSCHGGYAPDIDPGSQWQGSMMAQAARDPLFWAATTVAAQDSVWALGRPNATDLCLRCHTPPGWLGDRSDPTNGSALLSDDFDGVTCDSCHRMVDPFFEDTAAGTREGSDWTGYWDETGLSSTPSGAAAATTLSADEAVSLGVLHYNGTAFYDASHRPVAAGWDENGGGQFVVSGQAALRGPFADSTSPHTKLYSRYHKSKHFCGTCHDVSNPALANLSLDGTPPGPGAPVLPSESQPAYAYGHVERTFSEFMLSAYAQAGGADGLGPFAPGTLVTSKPGNKIASCQDCHMASRTGQAAATGALLRPTDSVEHPKSGIALHDLTGGNVWVPRLLASSVPGSANYDAANDAVLNQGAAKLTVAMQDGLGLDPAELLAAADRAMANLKRAASIASLDYQATSGELQFRIQNQTGHKLISGFPEGRRMFANIRVYQGSKLVAEVNPYDWQAGTLKGLDPAHAPDSPPLGSNEQHDDHLVYEETPSSALTGEQRTFHFVLATTRYKDNRIPPAGFDISGAAGRLVEPYSEGAAAPGYFTAQEYAGGYDEVDLHVPVGADGVLVTLYYQSTSREYVAFLRDEMEGTATSLASPTPSGEAQAYVAQSDAFFSKLAAWGSAVWQLWDHNKNMPGAAPVVMAQAAWGVVANPCAADGTDGDPCEDGNACTQTDRCLGGTCVGSDPVTCEAKDECHGVGVCATATGQCSNPAVPDGTPCATGQCEQGICEGSDAGVDAQADAAQDAAPDATADAGSEAGAGGTGGGADASLEGGGTGGQPEAGGGTGGAPAGVAPAANDNGGCGCLAAGRAASANGAWALVFGLLWGAWAVRRIKNDRRDERA